jgi:hypothetical protein
MDPVSVRRAVVLGVFFAVLFAVSIVIGAAAGQPTLLGGPLPDALRAHLRAERFELVTSIRGLPLGIRDALQRMWNAQTLDIAEPGAAFQGTAVTDRTLPSRRLLAAGCSVDHHCVVYYERSGPARAWHVALFQWTPEATRFEGGGTAPGGLTTLEDVRQAIASSAIGRTERW